MSSKIDLESPWQPQDGSRWFLNHVVFGLRGGKMIPQIMTKTPMTYQALSNTLGTLQTANGYCATIDPRDFTQQAPGQYHYSAVRGDKLVTMTVKGA